MIEFNNVSKTYANGVKALRDVNIQIDKGEFVFIVGASGAGKSTFLKLIMREEVASYGSVLINNYNLNEIEKKQVPHFRRTLGVVFQDFRLIPNMKVYDNVAFAMRVIGAKEKDISKRVAYALSLVGLSTKARMLPSELSGGEQQRVALARALVNSADIIIADEPTGNVDPEMSFEIVDLLNHINANGTTVVMVTHAHDLVRLFDHRVITIRNGSVISDTKDGSVFEDPEEQRTVDDILSAENISNYYHAPNDDVEVEDFLKNYGSPAANEAAAAKSPEPAVATDLEYPEFLNADSVPKMAKRDLSAYFHYDEDEEGQAK